MARGKASNWVDRGEPLERTLARVLGHSLGLGEDDPQLTEHVLTIRGLVEADGTEVHVARHLRAVFAALDRPEPDGPMRRALGIALWHIAKAGLVRDQAERRARELMEQLPPKPPMSKRLREAMLRAPLGGSDRPPARKPTPAEADEMRRRR
jgi:hypothetical protein